MSYWTIAILALLAGLAYFVWTGFATASGPFAFLNQYSSGQMGAY